MQSASTHNSSADLHRQAECRPGEHTDGSWTVRPTAWQHSWDCCGHDDSAYRGVQGDWQSLMRKCRNRSTSKALSFPYCCAPDHFNDTVWTPRSCRLHDWSARHFCDALQNRTMLLVGDSTMQLFALSLMSALHGNDMCSKLVVFSKSELLSRPTPRYFERGRSLSWGMHTFKPDLVVFSTYAHQFENMGGATKFVPKHHHFNATHYNATLQNIFDTVSEQMPGRAVWMTSNPGGCGSTILDTNPEPGVNFDLGNNVSLARFFPDFVEPLRPYTKAQFIHFPSMDQMARAHAARTGVALLDAAPLYRRVDAHRPWVNDCLHFCANSNGPLSLLNVLLYHVLLSLNQSRSSH